MKPQPASTKKPSGKPQPATATRKTASPAPGRSKESGSWIGFLFKPFNLLFAFAALLFLIWCKTSMPSYQWVYQDLLKGGYQTCQMVQKEIDNRTRGVRDEKQREQIAYDTKLEAKMGVEFLVLKQIRDNTPPDAVILFPPPAVMTQKTSYLTLRYEITMKPYATHFLYPRTVVYEQEKGKNPYFNKVNYVFCLHGWGFQYLNYKPAQFNAVDVLPIHQSQKS
jgi:hypothetical protein